jgi:hypothetical protein
MENQLSKLTDEQLLSSFPERFDLLLNRMRNEQKHFGELGDDAFDF